MPITVTKKPFRLPTTSPEASPASAPIGHGKPHDVIASAEISAESAAVDPTDKSSSPAEMTNVIAMAITVTMAVVRAILNRLVTLRNPLSPMVMLKNSSTTAKNI